MSKEINFYLIQYKYPEQRTTLAFSALFVIKNQSTKSLNDNQLHNSTSWSYLCVVVESHVWSVNCVLSGEEDGAATFIWTCVLRSNLIKCPASLCSSLVFFRRDTSAASLSRDNIWTGGINVKLMWGWRDVKFQQGVNKEGCHRSVECSYSGHCCQDSCLKW